MLTSVFPLTLTFFHFQEEGCVTGLSKAVVRLGLDTHALSSLWADSCSRGLRWWLWKGLPDSPRKWMAIYFHLSWYAKMSILPVHVCLVLSHIWLFATPWTVACQAPLSMGFSRQEHWSGLSFPPPGDPPHLGIKPTSPVSPASAGNS